MKRDNKHAACQGAEEILWAKYKARGAELATLRAENARLTAECEALRADVVWGIKNLRAFMPREADALPGRIQWQSRAWQGHDGTDTDIRRAVREARTR